MRKTERGGADDGGGEEVEVVDVVVVVGVEVDELMGVVMVGDGLVAAVVVAVVVIGEVSGLTGVEINQRIKGKSVDIVVGSEKAIFRREPVFKEVKSWLRGCRRVE